MGETARWADTISERGGSLQRQGNELRQATNQQATEFFAVHLSGPCYQECFCFVALEGIEFADAIADAVVQCQHYLVKLPATRPSCINRSKPLVTAARTTKGQPFFIRNILREMIIVNFHSGTDLAQCLCGPFSAKVAVEEKMHSLYAFFKLSGKYSLPASQTPPLSVPSPF